MTFSLDHTINILERTPATVVYLLRDLPEELVHSNEGPDTWSPFDIVGHFIHGEDTDWIPRIKIILECGTGQPFEPFDRFAQFERFKNHSMGELLKLFAGKRKENLDTLSSLQLTEVDLTKKGIHPELGEVNLRQLLSAWAVHDLGHIAQICRVMAKQYAGDVGVWKDYLPILSRP